MSCPSILSVCEDDYLRDQEEHLLENIIVDENLKESLEYCQHLKEASTALAAKHIYKRSPVAKKRGGSRGSGNSRGSSRSTGSSRGSISSKVRAAFSGSGRRKSQKVLSTVFGNKKRKFGGGAKLSSKNVKRKGGIFKKIGKYAVVGLAGTKTINLSKLMFEDSL